MTRETLLEVLENELGMDYTAADLDVDTDQLAHWDSVQVLRLITALEGHGLKLPLDDVLGTRTLGGLLELRS